MKKAELINKVKIITNNNISGALSDAANSKRAREPILIHDNFSEVPQRYVNCLVPGSYVRPHMHTAQNQWELMCWLRGEFVALIFNETGTVIEKLLIDENNIMIIEIPPFCYHTFVPIQEGAYLEIRNCNYQPSIDRIYSSWSPEEDSLLANDYKKRLFLAEVGDSLII